MRCYDLTRLADYVQGTTQKFRDGPKQRGTKGKLFWWAAECTDQRSHRRPRRRIASLRLGTDAQKNTLRHAHRLRVSPTRLPKAALPPRRRCLPLPLALTIDTRQESPEDVT